ncbi:hypothetical protein Plec18167_002912 [Paecilomyces lecythidis]|uniref:Uncharacterized protein n=1 Tax=Paecilomyces lecythidis TaxID=3004212 RepID=A0ABR3Y2I2_9EURO
MLRNIQEIHRKAGNVGIRNLQVFTGIIGNETAELDVHFCDLGVGGAYYSYCIKRWHVKEAVPAVWKDVILSFRNAADESIRINKQPIELSLQAITDNPA